MRKTFLLLWASLLSGQVIGPILSSQGGLKTPLIPIPSVYQDLYTQLNNQVIDFQKAIAWNGVKSPVLYTGELTFANANVGPQMLTAITSIRNQMLLLKSMGYKAVAIEAGFPIMYQPFYAATSQHHDGSCPGDSGVPAQTQQQQWVSLYTQIAQQARALGFKIVVNLEVMDVGGQISGSGSYANCLTTWFPSLGWTGYKAARAVQAVNAANALTPDYLALDEEPDTEWVTTGYSELNTVSGAVDMVNQEWAAVLPLKATIPNMKVGAGFGNWEAPFNKAYQSWTYGYTTQNCSVTQPCVTPRMDFFDLHFFIVNTSAPAVGTNPPWATQYQLNTLDILNIAKQGGMPITGTQAWLHKVRDSEWQNRQSPASSNVVQEARETFGFWASLDSFWFSTLNGLANKYNLLFLTLFNTQEYPAYQTWSSTNSIREDGGVLPAGVVFANQNQIYSAAALLCQYSTVARYIYRIITPTDTIVPTVPGNLQFQIASKSSVKLTWNEATDNVGVSGYRIWRDAIQFPDQTALMYLDTGLSRNVTYTYTVRAFDLAGNLSQPATVQVLLH